MQINELINNSYETAKSKGWWDDKNRNIPELLALIHSEVSEALDEYRENGYEKKYYRENDNKFYLPRYYGIKSSHFAPYGIKSFY